MKLNHPSKESPTDVILPVLARFMVMATAATADNERDFAHHTRHFIRTSRGLAKDSWRAAERRISEHCSGQGDDYLQQLARDAQLIWLEGFKSPRACGKERMNFVSGTKTTKKVDKTSLNSWVAKRRSLSASETAANERSLSSNTQELKRKAQSMAGSQWTEGHDSKQTHLEELTKKRRFDAQQSGQLLSDEKLAPQEFKDFSQRQAKADMQAWKKYVATSSSFASKLKRLEELVKGHEVCFRGLPAMDEQACARRLSFDWLMKTLSFL